jgi:hypothetical protein
LDAAPPAIGFKQGQNFLRRFAVAAEYESSGNQGSILPQQLKPPRLAELLRVVVLPPLRLDVTLPLSVCLSLAFASDRRSGCATSSAA